MTPKDEKRSVLKRNIGVCFMRLLKFLEDKEVVESCVDDPNKARNNFGSTFLKSNPNLTPQKLKILS